MNVSSLSNGFVRIERDGNTLLGVATGIPGKSFAIRKLSVGTNLYGWIIRGDSCDRWNTAGVTEHSGSLYVYGPYVEGRPLRDVLNEDETTALAYLDRLAHALRTATYNNIAPEHIHGRGVLFLDDGGVLLLPETLVDAIRDQQDEETRRFEFELFNHPDHKDEKNASFALAALAHRVLTGSWPYYSDDEAELHTMIREESVLDPTLRRPDLRNDVATLIHRCLRMDQVLGADEWVEVLHDWRDSGVTRPITDEERDRILKDAEQKQRAMKQQLTRRETVRKHWKQALVVLVIVVIVGTIPATIIRNRLAPRQTAGMSSEEVVRAFYLAHNDLDHELMGDATIEGAGSGMIREVTNLFVISRMRMGVEMTTGVVSAAEWDEGGREAIPEDSWLYGVTGLETEPVETGADDEREYIVRYERWTPDDAGDIEETPEAATAERRSLGVRREDRVRLRLDGDDWVIYEIEHLTQTRLEPPEFE